MGLKSNISKCEIGGNGPLQEVHVAIWGLKSVELRLDTVNIVLLTVAPSLIIDRDSNQHYLEEHHYKNQA